MVSESGIEERIMGRREPRRGHLSASADDLPLQSVAEPASQSPYDPLRVPSSHLNPFDAELVLVKAEGRLLLRRSHAVP